MINMNAGTAVRQTRARPKPETNESIVQYRESCLKYDGIRWETVFFLNYYFHYSQFLSNFPPSDREHMVPHLGYSIPNHRGG